jgi:predicted DNA-binding transcriptional regulator AlpA
MECEPLMDARKVATLLGISLRTLDTLVARGEAPAFIRIGQARRWRMAEINVWIEARLGGTGHSSVMPIQPPLAMNPVNRRVSAGN